ncbi:hypothetical protein CHUAL_006338 [Chamberlinius hualienensis]
MFPQIEAKTSNPSIVVLENPAPNTQDNSAIAQKTKLKKMKCWIIALVILGLAFVSGTVLITYFATERQPSSPMYYKFVLKGQSSDSNTNVETHVDPSKNIDYITSPEVDQDGKVVGQVRGIRDRNTDFEAFISKDGDKCLVGKVSQDNENDYGEYVNGSVNQRQVQSGPTVYLLNQTIHPYVLKTVAGENIVNFCKNKVAVWMIPKDEDDSEEGDRAKLPWIKWNLCKSVTSDYTVNTLEN